MFKNLLNLAVFLAGLAVICWIGAGYVDSNPLGVAVAAVIGACYLTGSWELFRYRGATATLRQAVLNVSAESGGLGEWLGRLHPSLRNAVRLRVEGERVGLPAPALTSYLVGLLVLLGMLGTLLGMMATLRGTGSALQSATDLQAIRGSLAAPVNGLAFAFGTSIAGVAGSAMLGLLSALCRSERLQAVQQLDVKIATTLRVHSQTYQREEAFKLLQQQTELMPTLIDRLQAMMTGIEQQNSAASERQRTSQDTFHTTTETTYARLASSVDQSLKETLAESARATAEVLQPMVATTMAGIARETTTLHETVAQAMRQQLEDMSAGFETTSKTVTGIWAEALTQQRETNALHAGDLRGTLEQFALTFEQRSSHLIEGVSTRLDATANHSAQSWAHALSQQETQNKALADHHQQALNEAATAIEKQATSLVQRVQQSHTHLQSTLESRDQRRLATWSDKLDTMTAAFSHQWEQTSQHAAGQQQSICDTLARTATDMSTQAQMHATQTITEISRLLDAAAVAPRIAAEVVAEMRQKLSDSMARDSSMMESLVKTVQQSHENLQSTLESRDQQRLATWSDKLDTMTAAFSHQWKQTSEHAASQQQAICDTLARTAAAMSAQAQTHATHTIAEISQLMDAAAEAPRIAAEVVAGLRQKLSDSMVRDTSMLEERGRLLATLETLLDAVNHASTEQRAAVDSLVTTSADLLERVGSRFIDQVANETGKLDNVAAQLTCSAVEVASLGEAFGAGVALFSSTNEALMERLQQIGGALDNSLSRSDEQLAYYVAQAREVVDLSVLSQKQIIEDMQRLASQQAASADAPA